jgi:hypothetical protein
MLRIQHAFKNLAAAAPTLSALAHSSTLASSSCTRRWLHASSPLRHGNGPSTTPARPLGVDDAAVR